MVVAETIPKYTLNRSEGTAAGASLIWASNDINIAEKDVSKMGGVTFAWTNGGGPTVGTAPMAIAIRNTLAHIATGFVLV